MSLTAVECVAQCIYGVNNVCLKRFIPKEVHNLSFPVPGLCLNSNWRRQHCKVMKYFENNLSGLYASPMLKHGGKGWDMSEEEG